MWECWSLKFTTFWSKWFFEAYSWRRTVKCNTYPNPRTVPSWTGWKIIYVSNWHLSFNLCHSRHCLRFVIVVPEIWRELYPFLLYYEGCITNHNSFATEIKSIDHFQVTESIILHEYTTKDARWQQALRLTKKLTRNPL